MTRAELRDLMRARRIAVIPAAREAAAAAITARLDALPGLNRIETIAGYDAVAGEPSLANFATLAHERGQRWFLPRISDALGNLRFAPWQPGCLMTKNRYAIQEPVVPEDKVVDGSDLDLVLVPLLAFDRHGRRLGSGGGYYDRTFAFLLGQKRPSRPVLVGVGWSFQEAELDSEPWDVPLDWVVTEREAIRCFGGDLT